ncbi:MAG: Sec-independent protein translocase subunit TatA [Gammaproteobacteria bacterium]|nr:Sec-independent protein translocase subunit TatA [Gammaproteobacteria bacterium]NND38601.1 Sec-independent protein translocase subunit TatA [Pseudomonadales bacterium]MBT8150831.1 Sec-independent protein translocase subunit TatA [Gammaproteobacteria bacterium]NNL11561.1 Sec-independent protein translocase subunit TatA [Pseudomonadales bacterium]NNM11751.1 Sec-independent protein translocase subunit TatA [Pseudomonadales bacterium]
MGLGGISIWQLLIILLIVVMIFGTKRLKNVGSDLGGAIKGFKKSIQDDDPDSQSESELENDKTSSASEKKTSNSDAKH